MVWVKVKAGVVYDGRDLKIGESLQMPENKATLLWYAIDQIEEPKRGKKTSLKRDIRRADRSGGDSGE